VDSKRGGERSSPLVSCAKECWASRKQRNGTRAGASPSAPASATRSTAPRPQAGTGASPCWPPPATDLTVPGQSCIHSRSSSSNPFHTIGGRGSPVALFQTRRALFGFQLALTLARFSMRPPALGGGRGPARAGLAYNLISLFDASGGDCCPPDHSFPFWPPMGKFRKLRVLTRSMFMPSSA
jgi:hypothetical protein